VRVSIDKRWVCMFGIGMCYTLKCSASSRCLSVYVHASAYLCMKRDQSTKSCRYQTELRHLHTYNMHACSCIYLHVKHVHIQHACLSCIYLHTTCMVVIYLFASVQHAYIQHACLPSIYLHVQHVHIPFTYSHAYSMHTFSTHKPAYIHSSYEQKHIHTYIPAWALHS
jgi:hypothetical protein